MTSRRRLNSVVHNVTKQAYWADGFGYGYHELEQLCKQHGYQCVRIDLLSPAPAQQVLPLSPKLLLGLDWLRGEYLDFLYSERFVETDVQSAKITIHFPAVTSRTHTPEIDCKGVRVMHVSSYSSGMSHMHFCHAVFIDDLGDKHESWIGPGGKEYFLKRVKGRRTFTATINEECLNPPVLYAAQVGQLIASANLESSKRTNPVDKAQSNFWASLKSLFRSIDG